MPVRRMQSVDPRFILAQMEEVMRELRRISDAEESLREHVRLLILLRRLVNEYGASLLPEADSARGRILAYFKRHAGEVVDTEELAAVSGIQESARRIRELREQGYHIVTGVGSEDQSMAPDQYMLLDDAQDDGDDENPEDEEIPPNYSMFPDSED